MNYSSARAATAPPVVDPSEEPDTNETTVDGVVAILLTRDGVVLHDDSNDVNTDDRGWSVFFTSIINGEAPHQAVIRSLRRDLRVNEVECRPIWRIRDEYRDGQTILVYEVRTPSSLAEINQSQRDDLRAFDVSKIHRLHLDQFARRILSRYAEERPCPPQLLGNSYLAEIGEGDKVWTKLRRHIPQRLIDRLTECVFIMLKPDALQSGRHSMLLSRFEELGWQLVHAHTVVAPTQQQFEELYQYNLTVRNEDSMVCVWWLNRRLYTMAPSMALLYRMPPTARVSGFQQIKGVKGGSNPYAGTPGQLRWDAGATSIALNLMHASDDPLSTAREFLIFGTPDQLVAALQRADDLAAEKDGVMALRENVLQEQVFLAGTADRRFDLPTVLIRIKSRLRETEGDDRLSCMTTELYRGFRDLVVLDLDIGTRWRRYCDLCAQELAILDRLAAEQEPRRGLELMRHLADPFTYRFDTANKIRAEFLLRHLKLDEWDELALDTGLYYRGYQYLEGAEGDQHS